MRLLLTLLLVLAFLATGCSSPTYYWYHPDRTLDDAKADFAECLNQAHGKAKDVIDEQHYDRLPPPDGPSAISGSPKDQGRTAEDPDKTQRIWSERYEQSVLNDCMRSKGYLRLRPDRLPRGVHTKKFDQGAVAGR